MAYNLRRLPIKITSPTLVAGQSTTLLLSEALQQLSGIALGHSYLTKILVEVDATFVGNAADTVGENRAHDVMRALFFRLPGTDRPVYELPAFAGSRLRYWHHATKGKRSRPATAAGGVITPAAGGGTAVRLKYEIPCYLPRALRGRDVILPLEMLREAAEIEMVWASGLAAVTFGANITVTGTVVRATAVLEEKPEFVVPVPFSVQLVSPGVAEGNLGIAGRTLHSILEVSAEAVGAGGDAVIADAARDEITISVDGREVTQRMDSRALSAHWNDDLPATRDEEIPDPEAGTQTWLPWFYPNLAGNEVQLTKLPLCVARPQFRVTGTSSTPILVVTTFDLNDRSAAINRIKRSGVAIPDGFTDETAQSFLTNKTGSKQPAAKGTDGASRLPVRLHMKPIGGGIRA